jgi:hypothetical protein
MRGREGRKRVEEGNKIVNFESNSGSGNSGTEAVALCRSLTGNYKID